MTPKKRALPHSMYAAPLLCASTLMAACAVRAQRAPKAPTIPKAAAPSPIINATAAKSVALIPVNDPWAPAQKRLYDISNHSEKRFDAFVEGSQEFKYDSAYTNPEQTTQVTLSYDPAPTVPYFVGRLTAQGLKPNFAYQIKLVGKPVKGARGWKDHGDDLGNERLGYAGRWWCDTYHATQTNFDDSHYVNYYKNAPENGNPVHDIYGYLYTGVLVTDSKGNATLNFTGKNSYHITWAGWQSGLKDVEEYRSPFTIQGGLLSSNPTVYYGYGVTAPTTSVPLYYEYEGNGRPRDNVVFGPGTYRCRLVLTEETFHNSASNPEGGYWKGVLGSEDFGRDVDNNLIPDSNPDNDVTFTITSSLPESPNELAARTVSRSQIDLSWRDNAASESGFRIERSQDGVNFTVLAILGANTTAYSNTGLARNTAYYYRVRSYNTVGNSSYSNTVSIRTLR